MWSGQIVLLIPEENALIRRPTSKVNRQLVVRSKYGSSLLSQTYHTKRGVEKFNTVRAKRLLHIGMLNNAMRGLNNYL